MRKVCLGLVLWTLSVPCLSWGQAEVDPCEGFGNSIPVLYPVSIENALAEYTNPIYRDAGGDAILLCFVINATNEEEIPSFNNPLTLHNTSGLPVVISGLNIRGGSALGNRTLLSLSGAHPVTVRNSSFTNCANCLSIRGHSSRVANTTVDCGGRENGSVGIRLRGEDHHIAGPETAISNCGTGILLGAIRNTANNNEVRQISAHHNGIAIHLQNGHGNYFRENAVFENDQDTAESPGGDGRFAGEEGILLASGSNNALGITGIIPVGEDDVEGVRGSLAYSEEVVNDFLCPPEGEWSATATIALDVSHLDGAAELYLTAADAAEEDFSNQQQGRTFFTAADCKPSEKEENRADCSFVMDNTYTKKQAVLLFQHQSYGTSSYSPPFILNDPCIGLFSAAELDAPAAYGIGPDASSADSAAGLGGAEASGGDLTPPLSDDESSDEEGNSMAANPIAGASASGTSGTVTAGGLGGSGAPGGVGGCGSSLNPHLPHGTWYHMVILFLPPAILILLRRRVPA